MNFTEESVRVYIAATEPDAFAAQGSAVRPVPDRVSELLSDLIDDAIVNCVTDGVPSLSVVATAGPSLDTFVPLEMCGHRIVAAAAGTGALVEFACYRVSDCSRTVLGVGQPDATACLSSITGLGTFPVDIHFARQLETRPRSEAAARYTGATVLDVILHRPDVGPTRFTLAAFETREDTAAFVERCKQTTGPSASAAGRIVDSGFGGPRRVRIAFVGGVADTAFVASAIRATTSKPCLVQRRQVNLSFRSLADAVQRELSRLHPDADRSELEAKLNFLRARMAAAGIEGRQPSRSPARNETGRSTSVGSAVSATSVGRQRAEVHNEPSTFTTTKPPLATTPSHQRDPLVAERDAALRELIETKARAARWEVAYTDLLEKHNSATQSAHSVEYRLRAELESQAARIKALEAELRSVSVAAPPQRATPQRRPPSPIAPASRVSVPVLSAVPVRKSSPGPSRSSTPRTTTTALKVSPRDTTGDGTTTTTTKLARQPSPYGRTETQTSARPSIARESDATRSSTPTTRKESPRQARELLARCGFVKATESSVKKATVSPTRVAAMEAPPRPTHGADVATSTVRPRLATPVRTATAFRSAQFETNYRPTRIVRHNPWETADDALRRDEELRMTRTAGHHPAGPAPPALHNRRPAAPPSSVPASH
jgi:hypothetical protein